MKRRVTSVARVRTALRAVRTAEHYRAAKLEMEGLTYDEQSSLIDNAITAGRRLAVIEAGMPAMVAAGGDRVLVDIWYRSINPRAVVMYGPIAPCGAMRRLLAGERRRRTQVAC